MRSKKEDDDGADDDDDADNVRTAEVEAATRLFHDGRVTRSSRRFRANNKEKKEGDNIRVIHWVLILSVQRATSVPLSISY